MGTFYERGLVLYQSKHFELAEKEFRHELAEKPDSALAHAMLAFTLFRLRSQELGIIAEQQASRTALQATLSTFKRIFSKQSHASDRLKQAQAEAKEAITLAPESSFCHYTLAFVLFYGGNTKQAGQEIEEALRLEPTKSYHFALASSIAIEQKRWQDALMLAEQGLSFEPDDIDCINNRALSLVGLERKEEAAESLNISLSADPEDYRTHAHKANLALKLNDSIQALQHAREALRLNPNSQWARKGLVKAVKSENIFYHALSSLSLWVASIDARVRLVMLIIPQLRILILFPVLILWIIDHCFNFALSLDPMHKSILSKREIVGARSFVIGSSILIVLGVALNVIAHSSDGPSVDSVMSKAKESVNKGHLAKARQTYGTLIEQANKNVSDGYVEEADSIYDRLLAIWSEDFGPTDSWLPTLLISSARCKEFEMKHSESERLTKQALSLLNNENNSSDHTRALAYTTLARAQYNTGQQKDAEESLSKSKKLLHNNALYTRDLLEANKLYAEVLRAEGRNDQSAAISAKTEKVVDYESYMNSVSEKIKLAWHPPKTSSNEKTILKFQISNNGTVKNIQVQSSSKDPNIDRAAVEALKQSSPLPPTPQGASDPLSIQFTFDYGCLKNKT